MSKQFKVYSRPTDMDNPTSLKPGPAIIANDEPNISGTVVFELSHIKTLKGAQLAAIAANKYVKAIEHAEILLQELISMQTRAVIAVQDRD